MRAFACHNCGQLVFFENDACLNCGSALGFDWPSASCVTLFEPRPRCANAELAACNWLVDGRGELCFSCALTRTRPADGDELGPRASSGSPRRPSAGCCSSSASSGCRSSRAAATRARLRPALERLQPVTTGHADGVITLDLAESDDAHRVAMREQMGEPYRTVLGHLRHEVGHYYFPVLVERRPGARAARASCSATSAPTTRRRSSATTREGPPPGWESRYVSAYATMHPAEDWAETFAHYLHIRDALQTAAAYGVRVDGPQAPARRGLAARPPSGPGTSRRLLADWLPLTYALNAINREHGPLRPVPVRALGAGDAKLAFVDERVRASRV